MSEIPKDVVQVEKEQVSLKKEAVDKIFQQKEAETKDSSANELSELNTIIAKNLAEYNQLQAQLDADKSMQYTDSSKYTEINDKLRTLGTQLDKDEKRRDKLKNGGEQSPFLSLAQNERRNVDDILSTINTKLEKLNPEDKQTFLVGLEQKIEGNFQKYVKSEASAGKALYEALRAVNHTEFVNNVQNVEKVSQAKSFAEAVKVNNSEKMPVLTSYFGQKTQETDQLKQVNQKIPEI